MNRILIKNGNIVNEGKNYTHDILINPPFIEKIDRDISDPLAELIDASGKFVMPGVIDDHVHFREPGLTYKGEIHTESKAAVAGGVTSYMDMPNVKPATLTQELLEEKFNRASERSWANYSFYMGVSNSNNLSEVLKTDPANVCGIKTFLGGAHGELLLEDPQIIDKLFSESPLLIASHCEHEPTILKNNEAYRLRYGDDIPVKFHPAIRDAEACYMSSSFAVDLATRKKARFHVLHLSTSKELDLFSNKIPVEDKLVTAEVCVHHLWFDDSSYESKGNLIKWNPAIKTKDDRDRLLAGLLDDTIDNIATDHAPHSIDEKNKPYAQSPSGAPFVQHSLVTMMEFFHQGKIPIEKIVEKMCHNPALMFKIDRRGFLREGYYADLAIVNPDRPWMVDKENILYKCGWSPIEGTRLRSGISQTIVSGKLVYSEGMFTGFTPGMRLVFNR